MATIVSATIPLKHLALGDTLPAVPGAKVEIVRVVANSAARTSVVWGGGPNPKRLTARLEEDSTTTDVEVMARFDDARLYEVSWHPSSRIPLISLLSGDGVVLETIGTADGWKLRLLFPDHSDISAAYDGCVKHGIDLQIESVYQLSDSSVGGAFDLTDSQYDTLTTAYDVGYYDVPRRTTLQEMSGTFGISHQALSERIRRGHASLVANALLTDVQSHAAGL